MKKILASLLLLSTYSFASNVAVIDSGTDFRHNLLKPKAWTDSSGLNGWNFADNNSKVYDSTGLEKLHPAVYKFMEVVARIELNAATTEDKAFIEKLKALPQDQKEKFLAQADWYGTHAHGTHCSGIVSNNKLVKIASEKLLSSGPTPDAPIVKLNSTFDNKLFAKKAAEAMAAAKAEKEQLYTKISKDEAESMNAISTYTSKNKLTTANMSFGMNIADLAHEVLMKTDKAYAQKFLLTQVRDPAKLKKESQLAFSYLAKNASEWPSKASNTLFVIAAANASQNNDTLPVYPANVQAENLITVAATNGYKNIADFSDYGVKTVHVAAPGVAVMSSVPHATDRAKLLPMSGTSMAAPFVSMVASGITDVNSSLTPVQVKTILMGTVDVKAWLKTKVSTSGIVNAQRAIEAAKLSKTMALNAAIAKAKTTIADLPEVGAVVPGARGTRVPVTAEMKAIADRFHY